MNILFCTAEADPYAKVGGLADVALGLPRALTRLGHDVRVVMPCHATAEAAFVAAGHTRRLTVRGLIGEDIEVEVATITQPGEPTVVLVRDGHFFPRVHVYGEPDDLLRYQLFCRAIAALLREPDWQADIVHLNDWHTAPLAYEMRLDSWSIPGLEHSATVLTIHNLRYRGPDNFADLLGNGIYYADAITTVSPRYANEILGWEHGEGLDDLLRLRQSALTGILNGLDTEVFDPATDTKIAANFDASSIDKRSENRAALRKELEMSPTTRPLAALVTRLTNQKGIDVLMEAVPGIIAMGVDVAVLGNGDEAYEESLGALQVRYPNYFRLAPKFDDGMARRMYAGSDFFLMPSKFEPCGIGQMIAMRYGSIPIGRRTGGLADTILDPWQHGDQGTGFLFDDYTPEALMSGVEVALGAYHDRSWWRTMQTNAMRQDFSWHSAAHRYLDVYRDAIRRRGFEPPE